MSDNPSNVVDPNCLTEGSNMYGCQPCPKCKGVYRVMYSGNGGMIECDDCGFKEKAVVA